MEKNSLTDVHWPTLLLLTALGASIRFYGLDYHGLWLDEVTQWKDSTQPLGRILQIADSYPPLYGWFLHGWIQLFGTSPVALRAPSALFGMVSVPLIYWIALRLFGRRTALFAGLFMATSLFNIVYSQEARMYTWLCFQALLSLYCWERALVADRPRDWAVYGGVSLIGLYLHNWFPLLVAAQGGWFLVSGLQNRRWSIPGLATYAAMAMAYLPWIVHVRDQLQRPVYSHLVRPGWKEARETLFALTGGRGVSGESWVGPGQDARWPLVGVAVLFIVRGLMEKSERGRLLRLLLVGTLLPIGAAFIFSRMAQPIYHPARYPILGLGALLLVVAYGAGRDSRYRWAGVVGCIWAASVLMPLTRYFGPFQKTNWKPVCEWIAQLQPGPASPAIVMNVQFGHAMGDYYFRDRKPRYVTFENPTGAERVVVINPAHELFNAQSSAVRRWRITDQFETERLRAYALERLPKPRSPR